MKKYEEVQKIQRSVNVRAKEWTIFLPCTNCDTVSKEGLRFSAVLIRPGIVSNSFCNKYYIT